MARATQPVSINGVEFDALIEENRSLEADAPSYPVETGFMVSDSIILQPMTLDMILILTNTPVTWKDRHSASPTRVADVTKQLEELYFSKTPVTVMTSEATYRNMAILSIELTKTVEMGTSREIPISFQEIRVTESRTVTIPDSYGKSGETGYNAGTANTKISDTPVSVNAVTENNNGSILYNLSNSSGLLNNEKPSVNEVLGAFIGG
ncbi:MAG: hypothetical protein LBS21_01495 [Clostridiales bacterium]|jgi:hypothetical protein|nr:hypothetical protein [Clostridiales bacterium]